MPSCDIKLKLIEKLNDTLVELNQMQKTNASTGRSPAIPYSTMADKIVNQIEGISNEIRES